MLNNSFNSDAHHAAAPFASLNLGVTLEKLRSSKALTSLTYMIRTNPEEFRQDEICHPSHFRFQHTNSFRLKRDTYHFAQVGSESGIGLFRIKRQKQKVPGPIGIFSYLLRR
jgi:hypothetical protein